MLSHAFIGTEHILLGLIHEDDGVAARTLREFDISLTTAREMVSETIGIAGDPSSGSPPFTPRAKKVLELALREALRLGHSYIGTEHLLLGLMREGEGVGAQVLVRLGADLSVMRQEVIGRIGGEHGAAPLGADPSLSRPPATGLGHTGLATCSFCGLSPPESGRLIAGDHAFICERCVRQWSGRIEAASEGNRPIVSHLIDDPVAGAPAENPHGQSPDNPGASVIGDPETPPDPTER
ncbi:MAG TPA: Clp protease N-terminal domain-containing protein [Acidimicrobiales bacterium]|nr:Clp protease N-terminal domain-containing protein [Acidimicrobiales bacterium]